MIDRILRFMGIRKGWRTGKNDALMYRIELQGPKNEEERRGISNDRLVEMATLTLRGQNSPIRETITKTTGMDWERQRKLIQVKPGTSAENPHGLTVSITTPATMEDEEAAKLGMELMRQISAGMERLVGPTVGQEQ